jgi:hypothetical protein
MHVDFKITTWERIEVPAEHEDKVKELVQSGAINNSTDMIDYFDDLEVRKIDDVDEYMTVSENGGCATLEVFEDGEPILDNVK